MEAFGMFGFTFGLIAFMMAGFAIGETSQLRKQIEELRKRIPPPPAGQ